MLSSAPPFARPARILLRWQAGKPGAVYAAGFVMTAKGPAYSVKKESGFSPAGSPATTALRKPARAVTRW